MLIRKIKLSKKDLNNIPTKDKSLLLLSGHSINIISTWIKLLRFSCKSEPESDDVKAANAVQSLIILRSLLGALAESNEWLKARGNMPFIRSNYAAAMPPEATESLLALQKHFGRNGLLSKIRNKLSYHHPEDFLVSLALENIPDDEDFHWLLGDHPFNFAFLSSESAVSFCLVELSGCTDLPQAFRRVMDEAIFVSDHLVRYLSALIDAIATKYIGDLYAQRENVEIDTKMHFCESKIEYFCKMP